MSERYTRDVKDILDAFMRAMESENSLSDDVLEHLRAMIAGRRMDRNADINTLVKILRDEANALHD